MSNVYIVLWASTHTNSRSAAERDRIHQKFSYLLMLPKTHPSSLLWISIRSTYMFVHVGWYSSGGKTWRCGSLSMYILYSTIQNEGQPLSNSYDCCCRSIPILITKLRVNPRPNFMIAAVGQRTSKFYACRSGLAPIQILCFL